MKLVVRLATLVGVALAGTAGAELPGSVEECYLEAARKPTSDTVYQARELCDAAFRPGPRVLAVLDDGECSEWWLDEHGRHESRDVLCSMERAGEAQWRFACQWKGAKKVTYVELREEGDRYVRAGELRGRDVGELFKSLAGCVRHTLDAPTGG